MSGLWSLNCPSCGEAVEDWDLVVPRDSGDNEIRSNSRCEYCDAPIDIVMRPSKFGKGAVVVAELRED